jgi:hypothetical protein
MRDFLISAPFQYAVLPLATALIGAGLKVVAKNDRYSSLKAEDFAVGLDLMLTACFLFVMLTTQRAIDLDKTNIEMSMVDSDLAVVLNASHLDAGRAKLLQGRAAELNKKIRKLSDQFAASGWYVVILFIALFGVSTLVRKKGWRQGSPAEMEPFIGVAIPLLFGVFSLIAVMAEAS